ncbi:hypothetical protein ONZ45_g321 [Pleurotus djamor]|nr:hypothetical protein ONZ45_g321 [Pleurotus djamor]
MSITHLPDITILPPLESLRLGDCSIHLFRPDHVTSLLITVGDAPPIDYIKTKAILLSTPHLRRLAIYGSDPFSLDTWPRDAARSIPLPSLDSLALRFTSGPMFSRMLTHVDAPLLRTLYLKELQEHDLDDFHSYSRLASVYFSKLASLTFDDFDLSALAYSKLAGVFPNLSEFNLIHSNSERAMLSVLLTHRPYAHIWPRLQVLRVPLHTVDEKQLCTIISLRSSLGMSLERIYLDVPRPSGIPAWITQLRDKIQVEVIYDVGYWSGDGHAGEEQEMIRHGESTDNLKPIWAGWRDAPLSNHGMNQAKALGTSLSSTKFIAIHASDLKRAWMTAEAIQEKQADPKPPLIPSMLLREQNYGIASGNPFLREADRIPGLSLEEHIARGLYPVIHSRTEKFPEGESWEDLAGRAKQVIEEILLPYVWHARSREEEEAHVAISSHGIFINEAVALLLRMDGSGRQHPAERYRGLLNTAWAQVVVKRLDGSSPENPRLDIQVTRFNEHEHLNDVTFSLSSTTPPEMPSWPPMAHVPTGCLENKRNDQTDALRTKRKSHQSVIVLSTIHSPISSSVSSDDKRDLPGEARDFMIPDKGSVFTMTSPNLKQCTIMLRSIAPPGPE